MPDAAALVALYLSFATLHAADSSRLPPELWYWKVCNRAGMRVLAALSAGAGVWFLHRAHDMTCALLVALTAFAAFATLFALLVPLFPRAVWGSALACPPLLVLLALLAWLGVLHG